MSKNAPKWIRFMKLRFTISLLMYASMAYGEPVCDVKVGSSLGIPVLEFGSGNRIYSKIPLSQGSPDAVEEEMINLQDEGVCAEKIVSKKCTLRFEKLPDRNLLTLFRGQEKWRSWDLNAKKQAESYVRALKKKGFCS